MFQFRLLSTMFACAAADTHSCSEPGKCLHYRSTRLEIPMLFSLSSIKDSSPRHFRADMRDCLVRGRPRAARLDCREHIPSTAAAAKETKGDCDMNADNVCYTLYIFARGANTAPRTCRKLSTEGPSTMHRRKGPSRRR
jgi:hypothetical protein